MRLNSLERLTSEYGIFSLQPELSLPTFSLADIRYSRGFLQANYLEIFRGLLSLWLPVFSAAEAELSVKDVVVDFAFPGELDRIFSFRVDGEISILGISEASQLVLSRLLLETSEPTATKVISDYLARRFIHTLFRNWNGVKQPQQVSFIGEEDLGEVEIDGHIEISFNTTKGPFSLHVGLGPEFLQLTDHYLKERTIKTLGLRPQQRKHSVVVEMAEVPESLVAGNLEPGVWLATELISDFPVRILDPLGTSYAGRLGQFNGRFAVESLGLSAESWNKDALRLELAQGELSEEDLLLMRQPGAIFLSKTIVSSAAQLTKQGRVLAAITLAELGGRIVFRIEEGIS